jgi:hypothetical protein
LYFDWVRSTSIQAPSIVLDAVETHCEFAAARRDTRQAVAADNVVPDDDASIGSIDPDPLIVLDLAALNHAAAGLRSAAAPLRYRLSIRHSR